MKQETSLAIFAVALCLSMTLVAAGPSTTIPIVGGSANVTPIYTEQKFTPLVFLSTNHGRVLFNNNLYFNGDLTTRSANYIFTGEQIQWTVLIWDKNGVPTKSGDVFSGWVTQNNGPLDPDMQSNCVYVGPANTSSLASQGFANVRPGDQEAQVNGNPNTMGIYTCKLTIEPNCEGQKWMGTKVIDIDGLTGTMQEAESWYCNPSIDLTKSGTINFGTLGPGEQGASTFSVKNNAADGSGIQVVLAIAGKDFYDPTPSGGACPTTNQLALQGVNKTDFKTGFWYTATMGANSVGNKRIPYLTSAGVKSADPIFSTGTGVTPTWTGTLKPMSPGSDASITLHLGLPQPCNGQFTQGEIDLFGWAI